MSRIGKKPIVLPKGVEAKLEGRQFTVKGPKGTLVTPLLESVDAVVSGDSVKLDPKEGDRRAPSEWGTTASLLINAIKGVSEGYTKELEIIGVGYRAELNGNVLNIALGKSHPDIFELPEGISAECPALTQIILKGIDKQLLGETAARIRRLRPPEPYKGKGIRYKGEYVRRKEGKAGATT